MNLACVASSDRMVSLWQALVQRVQVSALVGKDCVTVLTVHYPQDASAQEVIKLESATSNLPITCQCLFWQNTANLGVKVPFQIQIRSTALRSALRDERVTLTSVALHWSDDRSPVVLAHNVEAGISGSMLDVGEVGALKQEVKAKLRFDRETMTISGVVSSEEPHDLPLAKMGVRLRIAEKELELDIQPQVAPSKSAKWHVPGSDEADTQSWLSLPGKADRSICR